MEHRTKIRYCRMHHFQFAAKVKSSAFLIKFFTMFIGLIDFKQEKTLLHDYNLGV